MSIGIAGFVAFRQSDFSTVVQRYQNYWPGQSVDNHIFYPFNASAIISNASGGQESLSIDFAVSKSIIGLVETGLATSYFVELTYYQFIPPDSGAVPSAKTLLASYIGELTSAAQNESVLTINIGSSLDPVEAQAPPRKFSTTLIGEPPKI
jgi:hypothetical protein